MDAQPTLEAPAGVQKGPAEPSGPGMSLWDMVWALPRLLQRLLFPKLVDRYVVGELLPPLAFGFALFLCLFVFSFNLFRLASYAARGADPGMVGELLWLRVQLASVYCLPMAMLLSGLLAFGRLSGDSELIATQAGGIPNLRLIRNAFFLGLALSFLGLGLNELVIPQAGKRLKVVEDRVKTQIRGQVLDDLGDAQRAFVLQDYEGGRLARVVIAKRYEEATANRPAAMRDVTYVSYQGNQPEMIVQADAAEYRGPDEATGGRSQLWRFVNATTQLMANVTEGKRWVVRSDQMDLALNKSPRQVVREQKDADSMSYRELKEYLAELEQQGVRARTLRELEVEAERKLALPFAALVLALVGAPLGIRRQRSGTGVGVGLSLLIIVAYYVGMSFLGVLGQNGKMDPLAAAWGCNVVGLLGGLYLTWRASR